MGFWKDITDLLPWASSSVNKVTADMTSTAYMGVTMNNVQNCASAQEGGGDINIDIVAKGNVAIGSMDLSQTSTDVVNCFYEAENQATLTQSISDTMTVLAENNVGLMSALLAAEGKNLINTNLTQNATQQVQINNIQNCGIGSSNVNVNIDSGGNVSLGSVDVTNNAYSYLSCVFSSDNTTNLSQELAAVVNDTAANTKSDPFTTLIYFVVFVVIFIGLIIGGFIVFRITDGMFKSKGGPSVAQQLVPVAVRAASATGK